MDTGLTPGQLNYKNVGGNYYDKYGTRNPIAQRLVKSFLQAFDELSAQSQAETAYEVGCGEGMLSVRLLARGVRACGSDIEPLIVEEANQRANELGHGKPFVTRNLFEVTAAEVDADLLVCCEVLEHIPKPSNALDHLARLARRYLLISVPREPLWRVLNVTRCKYLSALGNTPGHINHWSCRQFLTDLAERFDIVAVRKPLPWTMALCRVRDTFPSRSSP